MVKLNERMEDGTDAAIPTTAEVNYVSQTIAKPHVSCRSCKWWEILPKPDEDYIEWTPAEHIGKCTKILHQGMQSDIARTKDDKSFIAGTFDGEDYSSGLITGAEFSCILFGRHDS